MIYLNVFSGLIIVCPGMHDESSPDMEVSASYLK